MSGLTVILIVLLLASWFFYVLEWGRFLSTRKRLLGSTRATLRRRRKALVAATRKKLDQERKYLDSLRVTWRKDLEKENKEERERLLEVIGRFAIVAWHSREQGPGYTVTVTIDDRMMQPWAGLPPEVMQRDLDYVADYVAHHVKRQIASVNFFTYQHRERYAPPRGSMIRPLDDYGPPTR